MRTIINLILIVVIAVVGYNYFFGSNSEKNESQEIVDQVKDLGKSIGDLIRSEKNKLEEGKYDDVVNKARSIFEKLESQINPTDSTQKEGLQALGNDLEALEKKVKEVADSTVSDQDKEELKTELQKLLEKAEQLLNESNQ